MTRTTIATGVDLTVLAGERTEISPMVNDRQTIRETPAGSPRSSDPAVAPAAESPDERAGYEVIVESLEGFIYLTSANFELQFLNRRLIRHLRGEPLGQKCYLALHNLKQVCPWCPAEPGLPELPGGSVYREILNPEDNRWYGSTITLVGQGAQGPARLVVFRDISERKQQEEETRRLAYYDALTGLPNRVLFADRLQKALAWARRHRQKGALLLLDLDRFKTVNDTRGHKMGDLLLREVGARLLAVLRQTDTIARFGGDEFLLLFSEIGGQEDVLTVAARIAAVFQRPFACAGEEVRITASLGCVVFPDDGEDADLLMQRADQAMYRAKRKGRKPPVFTKAPSASPTSAGRLSPGGHDSR